MEKIKIGVLGATGVVGQNYLRLLQGHPWFEILPEKHTQKQLALNGKCQSLFQILLKI
jgi:aspartate-semialdehyde dehydrogenase